MKPHNFDSDLQQIERHLADLSAGASYARPDEMVASATRLQEECVVLMQRARAGTYASGSVRADTLLRLKSLSLALASVREHLLRSAAYVDQSLAVVLATDMPSKYANQAARYAPVPRRSGEFRVASA